MAEFIQDTLQPHFNFWIYVILMMIGLWALIAKNNLIKKLIGLSIFQTAIILLYVSLGVKSGATIPILDHHAHEDHSSEHHAEPVHAEPVHAEAKDHAVATEKKKGDHHAAGESGQKVHHDESATNPDTIANPLPHVLMLTAIVVGVATLGVALSIAQMIFKEYGTLEEDEILEKVKAGNNDV